MRMSSRRFLTSAVAIGALAGVSAFGLNRALTSSRNTASDNWRTVSPHSLSLGRQKDRLQELFR